MMRSLYVFCWNFTCMQHFTFHTIIKQSYLCFDIFLCVDCAKILLMTTRPVLFYLPSCLSHRIMSLVHKSWILGMQIVWKFWSRVLFTKLWIDFKFPLICWKPSFILSNVDLKFSFLAMFLEIAYILITDLNFDLRERKLSLVNRLLRNIEKGWWRSNHYTLSKRITTKPEHIRL